jgi:hypothetical protein
MTVKRQVRGGPGARAINIVQKYFPEVLKVMDAKANVKVEVTKHDDTVATRKAHKTCAMAVACKREMKLDGVIISVGTAYLVKGKKAIRFKMPERASREIVSFDRGSGFATGSYELRKPSKHEQIGAEHGEAPSSTGPHTSKRRTHLLTTGIRTVLGSEVE